MAGAANNQLLENRGMVTHAADRGILYAPDYVANAGGVINVYSELTGWSRDRALRKADEIYETVLSVFRSRRHDGQDSDISKRPIAWPNSAFRQCAA